jgi:hypothetical protein
VFTNRVHLDVKPAFRTFARRDLDLTQLLSCQQSGSNRTRIADKSPKWTVLFELDRKDVNYSSAEETIRAGLRDSGLEAR